MSHERAPSLPAPLAPDASPAEVAACDELPVERRLALLRSWAEDLEAQLRAQGEGLEATGGAEHATADAAATLAQVREAAQSLDAR